MPGTAFIGLDFGSSLIKLAIRLEDVGLATDGRGSVFGVAFDGRSHAAPYKVFLETAIWTLGDGPDRRVLLRPDVHNAARRTVGIKELLIAGYAPGGAGTQSAPIATCGLTPSEATALLLASVLQDARTAIERYVWDRGAGTPSSFQVNCAVPSSDTLKTETQDALADSACPYRNTFRNLVERVRRFIFVERRALPGLEMPLSVARSVAESILAIDLPDDEGALGTACLPESLAAVMAATIHPRFREGTHFVFDIGAYTTDASLFHFNPSPHHQFMTYYATGTCRAGIGRDALPGTPMRPDSARVLQSELEALYLQMYREMLNAYPNQFLRAMFAHKPHPWAPKWSATIIGGGAKIADVPPMVAGLRDRREGGCPGKMRSAPIPFPEDSYERIVFIHGSGTAKTKHVSLLREERRHFERALRGPSHILQMSIGLTRNVLDCPPWSASAPPVSDRPGPVRDRDAWRGYNPWTGL